MGLFCCCFKPRVYENERKRILEDRNDVANVKPTEMSPSVNSLLFGTQNVCLSAQNTFEITVQKMATKMINIPALNNEFSQMLLRDRQKAYTKRVSGIRSPLPLRSDAEKSRPKSEQTSHHKHWSVYERCSKMEGISGDDLKLINKYSERASLAVNKGFSFWSDKPFVVEFDPNED